MSSSPELCPDEIPTLVLISPAGGDATEVYSFPLNPEFEYDPFNDLLDTIRWVAKQAAHVPALHALKVDSVRRDDYEALCDLCDAFNLAIRQHTATTGEAPLVPGRIVDGFKDSGLIVHIMTQVYNRGVKNPKLLNGYQAFSNEVYGEFNTNMITDVVRSANITEEDTFVDLGSGVGHVVLQMALQARCKLSYGIEIRDVPAKFATNLAADFERRIAWWGCYHSPFELDHGDFLVEQYDTLIGEADVLLVNNYSFSPALNQKLRRKFEVLREGARIISSHPFGKENFRINTRNTNDLAAILKQKKVTFTGQGVSWTDKPFDYYVAVVDRTDLERFFFGITSPVADAGRFASDTTVGGGRGGRGGGGGGGSGVKRGGGRGGKRGGRGGGRGRGGRKAIAVDHSEGVESAREDGEAEAQEEDDDEGDDDESDTSLLLSDEDEKIEVGGESDSAVAGAGRKGRAAGGGVAAKEKGSTLPKTKRAATPITVAGKAGPRGGRGRGGETATSSTPKGISEPTKTTRGRGRGGSTGSPRATASSASKAAPNATSPAQRKGSGATHKDEKEKGKGGRGKGGSATAAATAAAHGEAAETEDNKALVVRVAEEPKSQSVAAVEAVVARPLARPKSPITMTIEAYMSEQQERLLNFFRSRKQLTSGTVAGRLLTRELNRRRVLECELEELKAEIQSVWDDDIHLLKERLEVFEDGIECMRAPVEVIREHNEVLQREVSVMKEEAVLLRAQYRQLREMCSAILEFTDIKDSTPKDIMSLSSEELEKLVGLMS